MNEQDIRDKLLEMFIESDLHKQVPIIQMNQFNQVQVIIDKTVTTLKNYTVNMACQELLEKGYHSFIEVSYQKRVYGKDFHLNIKNVRDTINNHSMNYKN